MPLTRYLLGPFPAWKFPEMAARAKLRSATDSAARSGQADRTRTYQHDARAETGDWRPRGATPFTPLLCYRCRPPALLGAARCLAATPLPVPPPAFPCPWSFEVFYQKFLNGNCHGMLAKYYTINLMQPSSLHDSYITVPKQEFSFP